MNVALVTGASSGIGAAIAIAFADAGWSVMAAGRDEGRLEEVADVSDNISTWAGELIESADCDELVSDTIDEFGGIDCLVNAAGVAIRGSADELSDDDWRDTMAVNLDVPFFLSRAALPHLLEGGGSVVTVGSRAAETGRHPILRDCDVNQLGGTAQWITDHPQRLQPGGDYHRNGHVRRTLGLSGQASSERALRRHGGVWPSSRNRRNSRRTRDLQRW